MSLVALSFGAVKACNLILLRFGCSDILTLLSNRDGEMDTWRRRRNDKSVYREGRILKELASR